MSTAQLEKVGAIRRNAPRFGDRAGLLPQSRLSGPMPWVIAIMIAMTVIAAAAGLALRNLGLNAQAEIAGGLTVQIVEGGPAERARQTEVAVALLTNREDVAEVRRVPDAELAALIEPWLGLEGVAEEDMLVLPAMIDVRAQGPGHRAPARGLARHARRFGALGAARRAGRLARAGVRGRRIRCSGWRSG